MAVLVAACWLAGCAALPAPDEPPPLVEIESSRPGQELVEDEEPTEVRRAAPDVPLNEDTLRDYAKLRFPNQVAAGNLRLDYGDNSLDELVAELKIMGLDNIADLDDVIRVDFERKALHEFDAGTNIVGIMRTAMMVHDPERYFRKAWNNNWSATSICDFHTMRLYRIDLERIRFSGVLGEIDVTSRCSTY